ncbi:hypothetical protein [Embleya sp. NPDC059237]|uniref:hypothetical protein n=1 Tax=Embleya sp. NPDC059237 TaxID=3346784 RepID=UPI0036898862
MTPNAPTHATEAPVRKHILDILGDSHPNAEAQADAILDVIQNARAQDLADATLLRGMTISDGTPRFVLQPATEIITRMAAAAAGVLHGEGATNYVEWPIQGPTDTFVVTVQRAIGHTPAELKTMAEAEARRLNVLVEQQAREIEAFEDRTASLARELSEHVTQAWRQAKIRALHEQEINRLREAQHTAPKAPSPDTAELLMRTRFEIALVNVYLRDIHNAVDAARRTTGN